MGLPEKEAARLRELVQPSQTAVLTMELQHGVVGEEGSLRALVDEVRQAGVLDRAAAVCNAARAAGARVVHCTAETRHDGAGSTVNCKIFGLREKTKRETGHYGNEPGSKGASVMPQLGPDPRDIVVPRLHGMTPFTSTSLDQILRNIGVRTVVATGVSVNLGITGLCLGAVDRGYQVVLVRDAVAGVPKAYADAVIDNSLSLLATVVSSEDLLAAWAG
jgi:nicotinamidase-related amidase